MRLGPLHILAALSVAVLVNLAIVGVLSRTAPEAAGPSHAFVPAVPFVPEPPPELVPEPSTEVEGAPVAAALVDFEPPEPTAALTNIQLPGNLALAPPGTPTPGILKAGTRLRRAGRKPRAGPKEASAVDQPPQAISRRFPRYPAEAEARGIEGRVVLRLLIDAQGRVETARVVRAEPPGVFEAAAQAAVRSWRFTPARDGGKAVPVWAQQTLRFDLP